MSQFNEPWERIRVQYGYPLLIDEVDATPEQMVRIVACVNACAGIPTNMVSNVVSFGMNGHSTALQNAEDRREYWSSRWANEFDMRMEVEKQRDKLMAAAAAIEINAEECLDFDECTAMLVPIDDYHKLIEAIDSAKGINSTVRNDRTVETSAPAIVFYPAGSLGEEVAP